MEHISVLSDDGLPTGAHAQCARAKPGHDDDGVVKEAGRVLALSVPLSVSEILSFAAYLITSSQVGYLGKLELSSFTLARTIYHVTGLSLVVGLSTGISTLCGQAYGAKQYRLVGVLLQRAITINLLLAVPCILFWSQVKTLMALLGQKDEEVTDLAAQYIWAVSPALLIQGVAYCLRNYLAAQGVVTLLTLTALTESLLTPLVNWLLIYRMGWGLVGAAVAADIMAFTEVLLLTVYICWLHHSQPQDRKTWGGWSGRAALRGWGPYLHVALPSMAMICLDWWSFEGLILIAGLQKEPQVPLAAMGVCFNTHALIYMISAGLSGAASTRVANELGAGHAWHAKRAMIVCIMFGLAAAALSAGSLVLQRFQWPRLFTPDPDVIATIAAAIPFLCISLVGDSCNTVLAGTLKGAGRQVIGMVTNFVAFWCVGLPFAAYLDLGLGWGVVGLWKAMAMTSTLQAITLAGAACGWLNWEHEAARAHALVAAHSGHSDHVPARCIEEEEDLMGRDHDLHEKLLPTTEERQ